MVTITKEFMSTDIYETFYDLILANANSVTYGAKTYTLKTIIGAFSEKVVGEKANYPIVVINDPSTPTEQFTMGVTESRVTLDIDIFATSSKEARLFKDKIMLEIDNAKGSLLLDGIKSVDIEGTDSDTNRIGSWNSHFFTITLGFTYRFKRGTRCA